MMNTIELRGLIVALGVAGAVAGVGGPASAADTLHSPHASKYHGHKQAKLRHGQLKVKGTRGDDQIALRLKAGNPAILQVDTDDDGMADFSFRRGDISKIRVKAGAGNDHIRIDEANGVFTDTIPTTLDGGSGDDTLAGGSGSETLLGGDGNDVIDGNRGNDAALMGDGDDTLVWDPGDGSDLVEGQYGHDTMRFNGANIAEQFDLSANGHRLRFVRNVGNITMDTNGVEQVDVNALGGADRATVGDLSGTDVSQVNVDEGAATGVGDGAADQVIVNGTNAADAISVAGDATSGVTVAGTSASVAIRHQEPTDELVVSALDGNDSIAADGLAAGAITPTLDGGKGDDRIAGSQGAELTLGGDGNDTVDGNRGNDNAVLGAGDDTFIWDPGDGSDVVEGQDGHDTMRFNGANIAEEFDLSANGPRLRFVRNVGNITMDTDGVEQVDVNALGGADRVTVNDLKGTAVTQVNADLAGSPASGGDAAADRVIVNGTAGDDKIKVSGSTAGIDVTGLAAAVRVLHSEAANDSLEINTLAGTDTVDSAALAPGLIQLFVDGVLIK
jgi:Ca2+-binding RTX toxin-like protein